MVANRIGVILVLGSALAGCGPTPADPADESGTTVPATTGATEVGEPMCEAYLADSDIGPSVLVTVRNDATAPIFLDSQGCLFAPLITIITPAGDALPQVLDYGDACDHVLAAECVGGFDCGYAQGGRLAPGGDANVGWSGVWPVQVDLDPACVPEPECPATCKRLDQAPPGVYEVTVTAYRACSGACECDEGEGPEKCGLYAAIELGEPVVFSVMVDYPTQTAVEIAIVD